MDRELVRVLEEFLDKNNERLHLIREDIKTTVKINIMFLNLFREEGLVDVKYDNSWEFTVTDKGEKFFKEVVSFFLKDENLDGK